MHAVQFCPLSLSLSLSLKQSSCLLFGTWASGKDVRAPTPFDENFENVLSFITNRREFNCSRKFFKTSENLENFHKNLRIFIYLLEGILENLLLFVTNR
jgi:hypothetical protein